MIRACVQLLLTVRRVPSPLRYATLMDVMRLGDNGSLYSENKTQEEKKKGMLDSRDYIQMIPTI